MCAIGDVYKCNASYCTWEEADLLLVTKQKLRRNSVNRCLDGLPMVAGTWRVESVTLWKVCVQMQASLNCSQANKKAPESRLFGSRATLQKRRGILMSLAMAERTIKYYCSHPVQWRLKTSSQEVPVRCFMQVEGSSMTINFQLCVKAMVLLFLQAYDCLWVQSGTS